MAKLIGVQAWHRQDSTLYGSVRAGATGFAVPAHNQADLPDLQAGCASDSVSSALCHDPAVLVSRAVFACRVAGVASAELLKAFCAAHGRQLALAVRRSFASVNWLEAKVRKLHARGLAESPHKLHV